MFTWRHSWTAKKIACFLGGFFEPPSNIYFFGCLLVQPRKKSYFLAIPIQPPRQTQFGVVGPMVDSNVYLSPMLSCHKSLAPVIINFENLVQLPHTLLFVCHFGIWENQICKIQTKWTGLNEKRLTDIYSVLEQLSHGNHVLQNLTPHKNY